MTFWDTVEILRKQQNTSYRWLAQKMGISEQTVSTMRKAGTEPRASEAVKIARALNTTVESLVESSLENEGFATENIYRKKYATLKAELSMLLERC